MDWPLSWRSGDKRDKPNTTFKLSSKRHQSILRRCTWTLTTGERSLIRSATTTTRSWESSVEWHAATFQSLMQGSSLATSLASCCTTRSRMYPSSRMEPSCPSTSVNRRLDSFLPTVLGDLQTGYCRRRGMDVALWKSSPGLQG